MSTKSKTARRNNRKNKANRKTTSAKKSVRVVGPKRMSSVMSDVQWEALMDSEYGTTGPRGLILDLLAGTVTQLPNLPESMYLKVKTFTTGDDAYQDILTLSAERGMSLHEMVQSDLFGVQVSHLQAAMVAPSESELREVRPLHPAMSDTALTGAILTNNLTEFLGDQWSEMALHAPGTTPVEVNWHIVDADGSPCCSTCLEVPADGTNSGPDHCAHLHHPAAGA